MAEVAFLVLLTYVVLAYSCLVAGNLCLSQLLGKRLPLICFACQTEEKVTKVYVLIFIFYQSLKSNFANEKQKT